MKRQALAAVCVGALLAAWLTYPTIARPGSMARVDTNDGRFSLWNVAWVAHALLSDPAAARRVGLQGDSVKTLWRSFLAGRAGLYWSRIWALYILLWWCQAHELSLDH